VVTQQFKRTMIRLPLEPISIPSLAKSRLTDGLSHTARKSHLYSFRPLQHRQAYKFSIVLRELSFPILLATLLPITPLPQSIEVYPLGAILA